LLSFPKAQAQGSPLKRKRNNNKVYTFQIEVLHQLPSKRFFLFSFVLMIEKILFARRMPVTLPYLTWPVSSLD